MIDASNAGGLDPEAVNRFELELCWCIQQLEVSLAHSKLQKKELQDINRHIHSLKSNNVPLIKKRQIMRNTLGDYRERMVEDERKFSKTVSAVKFASVATANKKSVFLKKAGQHIVQELNVLEDHHKTENTLINSKRAIIDSNRTQTPFQFNFQKC